MAIKIQKAQKSKSFLRLATFGPAGAGKTLSGIRIMTGIAQAIESRVIVIDSERGSSQKYADRYQFEVIELEEKSIAEYCEALQAAAEAGYKAVVIDSLTHAWQELLEEIDRMAAREFKGNTWAAWSKGTPKQKALVSAILDYPGHIYATMRSKTEWQAGDKQNGRGGKTPERVGLGPEQGKGIEYEFDILGLIDTDHYMKIIKDRTGRYQDKEIEKPGEKFGADLAAWLNEGAEAPARPTPAARTQEETPPAETKTERNGRGFYNWLQEREKEAKGITRHIIGWANAQEFPARIVDWDSDQAILAFREAQRVMPEIKAQEPPQPTTGQAPKGKRGESDAITKARLNVLGLITDTSTFNNGEWQKECERLKVPPERIKQPVNPEKLQIHLAEMAVSEGLMTMPPKGISRANAIATIVPAWMADEEAVKRWAQEYADDRWNDASEDLAGKQKQDGEPAEGEPAAEPQAGDDPAVLAGAE